MKPDYEFLRDVAQAFDGIPAERVDLSSYGCQTLGCVAGHMAHHPKLSLGVLQMRPNREDRASEWRDRASEKISGDERVFAFRVVKFLELYGQPVSKAYKRKYGL